MLSPLSRDLPMPDDPIPTRDLSIPDHPAPKPDRKGRAIIHNRTAASLLIIAGFPSCVAASTLIPLPPDSPWDTAILSAIGALTFFLVGCFLPERQTSIFPSRRFALGVMALSVWTGSGKLIKHLLPADMPMLQASNFKVLGSLLIAILSYWLAIFLIRGLRAAPEYAQQSAAADETRPVSSTPPKIG